jgi:four helix bundle protein
MNQLAIENRQKLEKRTSDFGVAVIELCKTVKITVINRSIIDQLVRSATSIGANYMEANNASSRKDFTNKIFICKKEAQETRHWLKMLFSTNPERKDEIDELSDECRQLILIFQKISSTLRNNSK